MTDAGLTLLTQRLRARLPDVRGLVLAVEDGLLRYRGTCEGTPFEGLISVVVAEKHPATLATMIADGLTTNIGAGSVPCRLLPEIVLTSDVAIVSGGHAIRLAEMEQVVRAEARVDGRTYGAGDAERDLGLVMEALRDACEEGSGVAVNDLTLFRRGALALLSRLRLTGFGAPMSSAGGRWLASQAAQSTPEKPPQFNGEALQSLGTENLAPMDAETPDASPSVLGASLTVEDGLHVARLNGETGHGVTEADALASLRVGLEVAAEAPTWRYTETRSDGTVTETRKTLYTTEADGTLVAVPVSE